MKLVFERSRGCRARWAALVMKPSATKKMRMAGTIETARNASTRRVRKCDPSIRRRRACPQLDSPDPPRDNASNASPARAACDRRPRGRPPRRVERRREPRAPRALGRSLLSEAAAVPARSRAHHRPLLLRARGGTGRRHDPAAGEGADGLRLHAGGRSHREPRGAGTGAHRGGRTRAAALSALPPALLPRPLSSSRAAQD